MAVKEGALLHLLLFCLGVELSVYEAEGDYFGFSVGVIDDVDGDGHTDFLVGDPPRGIWLVSGASMGVIKYLRGQGLGWFVEGVSDADGDGVSDVLTLAGSDASEGMVPQIWSSRSAELLLSLDATIPLAESWQLCRVVADGGAPAVAVDGRIFMLAGDGLGQQVEGLSGERVRITRIGPGHVSYTAINGVEWRVACDGKARSLSLASPRASLGVGAGLTQFRVVPGSDPSVLVAAIYTEVLPEPGVVICVDDCGEKRFEIRGHFSIFGESIAEVGDVTGDGVPGWVISDHGPPGDHLDVYSSDGALIRQIESEDMQHTRYSVIAVSDRDDGADCLVGETRAFAAGNARGCVRLLSVRTGATLRELHRKDLEMEGVERR